MTLLEVAALGTSRPPSGVWPPPPREALPPLPKATGDQPGDPQAGCWSSKGDYRSTRPANIPDHPDVRWHRGNFCGVRVPGLTEGGNDKDPSLMFTWDWPRFSPAQRTLAIAYYADVCGYTHPVLSIPQCVNQGVRLEDLRATCVESKQHGEFNAVAAVSDGFAFANAIPWLDALHADRALDIVIFSWQADKWYPPQDLVQGILDAAAWAHPKGILTAIHWGGGYGGWAQSFACWNAITQAKWGISDRFTFQAVLAPALDCQYGQCDTEAPIDEVQSWLQKGFVAMPPSMMCVVAEDDAQAEYDTPHQRLEAYGDLKGYLAVCSAPSGRVSYLNGARHPNGAVL